jgi:hypothetical protein
VLKEKQVKSTEKEKLYKYFVQAGQMEKLKQDELAQMQIMKQRTQLEIEREERDKETRARVPCVSSGRRRWWPRDRPWGSSSSRRTCCSTSANKRNATTPRLSKSW